MTNIISQQIKTEPDEEQPEEDTACNVCVTLREHLLLANEQKDAMKAELQSVKADLLVSAQRYFIY